MISLERSIALSKEDRKKYKWVLRFLQEAKRQVYTAAVTDGKEAFALMKAKFDETVAAMKEDTGKTGKELHNLFVFVEQAFEEGNEMLILVTELTVNSWASQFIATFGSPDYQRHNQELMLTERQDDIRSQIAGLQL